MSFESSQSYSKLITHNQKNQGNAKTYSAWPLLGTTISGVRVDGTPRGLPPPRPVATAMYCLPPTEKLIGYPCTEVGRRVSHNTLPLRTLTALKLPARSPTKASPPAVDNTDVRNDARCSRDHVCFIVSTLKAPSLPTLPLVPGIS